MSVHAERSALKSVGRLLARAADAIGATLFLIAFFGFLIQIFYRYVLGNPLMWTEEFTMIAFIWTVFWSAAFLVPIQDHVSFDVLYDTVTDRTKRIFSIYAMVVALIAFAMLIPPTWDYLEFLTRKKSAVMRLPMHLIFGCYILFVCGMVVQAAVRIGRLCGRDWRNHI